jgi:hypothetical protein
MQKYKKQIIFGCCILFVAPISYLLINDGEDSVNLGYLIILGLLEIPLQIALHYLLQENK